jgi:antitoxin (DNA-binding transcriptional repressor) of toxin-antitoxin stability system
MSHTVPIEQAGAKLAELVGTLKPGDEIVLTKQDQAVAKIVSSRSAHARRKPGNCRGMLVVHQEDKEHLKGFEGYMP